MTTGSYHFGSGYSSELVHRTWTGADGKYETLSSGSERLRWNNFTATEITQIASPSDAGFYCNISGFPGRDDTGALWGASFSDVSNSVLRSQSDLFSNIRRHDFNLGIAIGEGKQTVRLCVDTLKRLGLAALNLKRGNFSEAAYQLGVGGSLNNIRRGYSNDVANRWLELQYGWKPLLNDVYEAAKAFEAIANKPRVQIYKGKGSDRVYCEPSQSPSNYSGGCLVSRVVYSTIELSEDFSISPRASLGLQDPKQVLWEMLPWSFVVDWFIPIGTYLESLQNTPALVGRQRLTKVFKAKSHLVVKIPTYYSNASSYATYRKTIRDCTPGIISSSIPLPKFKSLPDAMSPLHIANAIALAASRFSVR